MRSTPSWLLAAALVALTTTACKKDDKPAEHRVVVLFTTDEHSQLFASSPEADDFPLAQTAGTGALVGGVARRLAILERERAAATARGAETITLSAGDFSQGSLASAAWVATSPELRLMRRMGYDAVALGNHEFDLGPRALAAAIGAAAAADELPPLILSNVFFDPNDDRDNDLAAMYGTTEGMPIAPYRVLHTGHGLRIGIVASMGVEAGTVAGAAPPVKFWSPALPADATNTQKFGSIVAAVQGAVNHLRESEQVDAVILLGHGGIGPQMGNIGEDEALAGTLTGVDLVVSGHSHRSTPAPRVMYAPGNRAVPVVQARPYGAEVGKIEIVFSEGGSPLPLVVDATFMPVDDRTLPTTDVGFLSDLIAHTIGYLEVGPPIPDYPSFLEETLSTITGASVTDNAEVLGDLYFFPLGETTFDVVGLADRETNGMNLDTDALLAAGRAFPANPQNPPAIAIQAAGPIRGDLRVGETGVITFADVYHLVPLGGDPTATNPLDPNAIPGYPLVHALIPTAALRGVVEATLQQSLLNNDFFVGASGLVVKYDMSRTPYDQDANQGLGEGWVTYMGLADGTPLYDASNPALDASFHFAVNPATHVLPAVTTLYVASFASAFGVPLLNDLTGQPYASLAEAIVRRPDGSAVKDFEALGIYVKAQCDGNGGLLPSRYDASTAEGFVPRRMIDCTGGCPVPP